MDKFEGKTNAQLLELHNTLAEQTGSSPLKSWKQSKAKLIDRIELLEDKLEVINEADAFDDQAETIDELPPVEEIVEEIDAKTEQKMEEAKPKLTIRERSLQLLCVVDYYEDKTKKSDPENRVTADHRNARSVGIPYTQVIETIKSEFPDANTSVACLRWYAVKVRAEEFGYEGYRLCQRRPRFPGK
ncbi:hypothetical protein P67b_00018 [Ruegeria phage Tedan]|nr:hypothetical protein P67b_00018 [Ruegeria phage Tedan]